MGKSVSEGIGRRAMVIGLGAAAILGTSGCARVRQSRINPFNWFGQSRSDDTPSLAPSGGYPDDVDGRQVVPQVTQMRVDRIPGGALVTATGLPPSQGFWNAELIPAALGVNGRPLRDGSSLVFDFRISPPLQAQRSGTPPSREVTAGFSLTDQDLAGVNTIVVRGQNNRRTARR